MSLEGDGVCLWLDLPSVCLTSVILDTLHMCQMMDIPTQMRKLMERNVTEKCFCICQFVNSRFCSLVSCKGKFSAREE